MRSALWPDSASHAREVDAFLSRQTRDQDVFILERRDDRLGGFLEVSTRAYAEGCSTSPVAYIEGWYVDPDLREKGLGAQLVRAAEAWARERGYQEIASDAEPQNHISLRAHRALGYREAGRIVCFRKQLASPD